uniref:Ornithine decarboxylase n=1 Tax=Rhabditophanes sp. KR3021 TaxID=114890 RepID=A0AC35TZK2_9BILA
MKFFNIITNDYSSESNFRIEHFGNKSVSIFKKSTNSDAFAKHVAHLKTCQGDLRPFYVMNMGLINELVDVWTTTLPRVQPFYAVNSNNNNILLKLLASSPIMGFYANSKQTVDDILEVVDPSRIIYGNPLLTANSINIAAKHNIPTMTFSSERDLNKIQRQYPEAQLLLEVNVLGEVSSSDPNAFLGADLDEIPSILTAVYRSNMKLVGFSFNLGFDRQTPSAYFQSLKYICQLFEMSEDFGINTVNMISIGSGFSSVNIHNFKQIGDGINAALETYFPTSKFPHIHITARPGKFFSSSAFSLITNVISKKVVDASLITNDGYHASHPAFVYQTNEGYYGSFGCRTTSSISPQCTPLFGNNNEEEKEFYGTILGPTECRLDIVQELCRFRQMDIGDWLLWNEMGAYTFNNNNDDSFDIDDQEKQQSRDPSIFYFSNEEEWECLFIREQKELLQIKCECGFFESDSNTTSLMGSIENINSITTHDEDMMEDLKELFDPMGSVFA